MHAVTGLSQLVPITPEWMRVHARNVDLAGMPTCWHCGRRLRLGSLADPYYPHYDEVSEHRRCAGRSRPDGADEGT